MIDSRPGRIADQFNLRLPEGMRDRIKVAADLAGRSMNAEIVATLEERYPARSVDVRAVESLLHYISEAPTKAIAATRLIEVNSRFAAAGSPLRVEATTDGNLAIVTDF
jgi:plasmid stability protein